MMSNSKGGKWEDEGSYALNDREKSDFRTILGMVDAAGVEPASLQHKPAATTCLVRRESQPLDTVLTRIQRPSPHVIFSATTAQTPAFA